MSAAERAGGGGDPAGRSDAIVANESGVRQIFDAFARKQGFALRGPFAPDAVWTVPGEGHDGRCLPGTRADLPLPRPAPEGDGRDIHIALVDVLVSDDRAAALYRASGERHGRRLDLDQVLLFRLEDGLVQEVLALPSDPSAFEGFWA